MPDHNDFANLIWPIAELLRGPHRASLDWRKHEKTSRCGAVPGTRVEQKREDLMGGTGRLEACCQVAAWWLEQRIERMPA